MKITINTGLFKVSFTWNSKTFWTHLCILIGVVFSNYITRSSPIHKLCVAFLIIDIIVILFQFFHGFSIRSGEEEATEKVTKTEKSVDTPTQSDAPDVEVNHVKHTEKTKETKEQTIKNKVAVPNPTPTQTPISEPTVQQQQTGTESVPTEQVVAEMTGKFTQGDMTEEDWDSLFDLG